MLLEFTSEGVSTVPHREGVYQLLNEEREVIYVAGTMDLGKALEENLSEPSMSKARYFRYEENDMYTVRESELIQQFMQEHGRLPELSEEMLF
jgi:excinuclease UvrABC nuclease subunit